MVTAIKEYQQAFLEYLESEKFQDPPKELYAPINYILGIGGKRMRPILLLAAAAAFDKDWARALPAALGIEIFHNFTLLHDDIMDEAELRRGQPTGHIVYGRNSAILSGDAMMLLSLQYILRSCTSETRSRIVDGYLDVALNVCVGQQYDMNFEHIECPPMDDYLGMIRGKTAVLPGEALRIGATIGGADETQAQHLFDFGENLGMAFQMQDDWLDLYGDAAVFGKKSGGDVLQNKKTILFILGIQEMNSEDRQLLIELYSLDDKSNGKIEEVKALYDKWGVGDKVDELKQSFHDKSLLALSRLEIEEDSLDIFYAIAEFLLNRSR
ncbi:MAG: polyprenyl synthetase family protein [Saprospiraceae bacterium]|nr:polyprenyl synthetase family protein [Saprospiraceae bacterium]